MNILFPFRFKNLEEVLRDSENQPKEFLYGADQLLSTKDNTVEYFLEPRGVRDTLFKKILFYFERPFSRRVKLGLPHEVVLCHRKEIKAASQVVCINDAISFAFLLFLVFYGIIANAGN